MAVEQFDVLVIGGGKGGKTLAADLASAGKQVAMVERGLIGGSCINVACIPTKTIIRSAKVAELARHLQQFGVRGEYQGTDVAGVRARKRSVVEALVKLNQAKFDQSEMTLLLGVARFMGPRTVEVRLNHGGVRQLTAEKVFINTGTRPSLPALEGLADVRPLTSESLLELDRLPKHLIVLGAGYIGLEFAQAFHRFGSKVTVIERGRRFLSREDVDVAEQILAIFREDGIDVLLSAEVQNLRGQSGERVQVQIRTPAGERTVEGSDVLAAVGRVPNTEELNLPAAGVDTDARGFVKVNDELETTAPGVWALGDVSGGPQFTHASLDDYRIVKANVFGPGGRTTRDRLMPYTLFIDPELGRVGLTEEEAVRRGHQVLVGKLTAAAVPRARTLSEMRGLLKAAVDAPTGRILGVAILAPEGGEVMAVAQLAMQAGLPYTALRDMIFSHPSMAEGLNDLFAKLEPSSLRL